MADFIVLVGEKGFQGIAGIHGERIAAYKKPRKGELTEEQERFNSKLSKLRVFIGHISRRIKRLEVLQMRYRNKQRKRLLRVSLICGMHNYEIAFYDRSIVFGETIGKNVEPLTLMLNACKPDKRKYAEDMLKTFLLALD